MASDTVDNTPVSISPKGEGEFSILLPVENDQKPFQCGLCGRTFDVQTDLVSHVQQHAKPFQCGFCDASFDAKSQLIAHVDAHDFIMCVGRGDATSGPADRLAGKTRSREAVDQVEDSGEMMVTESSVADDDALEALPGIVDRPKVCIGRKRKKAKPLHMAAAPDDLLMCPTCGRRFQLQVDLRKHSIDEHGDDRPFQCRQCPSRFKQNVHLTDHMNSVHTIGKPHICPMCGDNFKLVSYLRLHIRRVHHVDPFSILGKRSRKRYNGGREINQKRTVSSPSKRVSVVAGHAASGEERQLGEGEGEQDSDTSAGEVDDCGSGAGNPHNPTQTAQHMSRAASSSVSPSHGGPAVENNPSTEWDFVINEDGTRIEIVATRSEKSELQEDSALSATPALNPTSFPAKSERVGTKQNSSEDPQTLEQTTGTAASSSASEPSHHTHRDGSSKDATWMSIVHEEVVTSAAASEQGDGDGGAVEEHDLFQCGESECQTTFPSAVKLRDHWKSEHNVCHCGEMFVDPLEMYNHRYDVHAEVKSRKNYKPYVCALCGAGFRVVNYLRDHIDKLHWKKSDKREGANSYPCPACSKVFPYLSWYTRHCVSAHAISPGSSAAAVLQS